MTTTTTKPLFTRKQLIALLLPLIAEQALSVTIGLADTLMVSSVGEAAVSGVSLVDSFNVLMIQLLSALATGGAVVASQYIGHREPKNAKAAAAQILFIMISLSVVVAAVVAVGRHGILRGIFGTQTLDVISRHPDLFEAHTLTAGRNAELLIKQARAFKPDTVVIADDTQYNIVQEALSDLPIKVYAGADATSHMASMTAAGV